MSNLTVWQDSSVPTPTPELTKSLSPQELDAHRGRIASEVRVVLSAYFQPSEPEEIRAAQLAWWCDSLEDWTQEQVVYGLRKWNMDNPRLRPTPGDIVKLLKQVRGEREAARQKAKPVSKPEPTSASITEAERAHRKQVAAEIMARFRS